MCWAYRLFFQDAFNRSKKLADGVTYVPVQPHTNRVFTPEQELNVVKYTILAAKMFYGLPKDDVRRMVYCYAKACQSKAIPEAWEVHQKATHDWYYAFMDRHPSLVLKAPEGMSIARIVAFNKVNVETFFRAYTSAMGKYQFTPDRIYNLDESSVPTVMKPSRVVCERGQPVASQISRERGESMTFVGIINAVGQSLPPVFIIPRKKWNHEFKRNTIYGSKFILHSSGWMNGELFMETLQHVHERTNCSKENKICLIIDNAECHMNIHVVEYAIEHGIVIVTLPPHTTDKLQPLDVSVFGPFKSYLRSLQNQHNLMHPNEPITLHMLPELASGAWTSASTPSNILNGFRATGIWPINCNIFPDDVFVAAQVTERPPPPGSLPAEASPEASFEGEGQLELEPTSVQTIELSDQCSVLPGSFFDIDDGVDPSLYGEASGALGLSSLPGPSTAAPPTTPEPGPSTAPPPTTPEPGPSTTPVLGTPAAPPPTTPVLGTPAAPPPPPATPVLGTPAAPPPATPVLGTPAAAAPPPPPGTPAIDLLLQSVRPLPQATPRPYGKGKKTVS